MAETTTVRVDADVKAKLDEIVGRFGGRISASDIVAVGVLLLLPMETAEILDKVLQAARAFDADAFGPFEPGVQPEANANRKRTKRK